MKILLMTIGGSDIPLVTSIKSHWPDRIYFFCSIGNNKNTSSRVMVEGEGLVCGDPCKPKSRPNILVQSGYPKEQTKIVEVEADDPYSTYLEARSIIERYRGHEVIVDYTGGTKSMTAGLLLAGAEFPYCQPVIVTGLRMDLEKVTGDLSRPKPLKRSVVIAVRHKETFKNLIATQDYDGALSMLKELAKYADESIEETLDRLLLLTGAFSDWDNFRYEMAYEKLQKYLKLGNPPKDIVAYKMALEYVLKGKQLLKEGDERQNTNKDLGQAPFLVYDLLWNAERKARAERYADAVARLYRAEEMYAQFALLRIGIFTSNVDMEKLASLPEQRRSYYEKRRNEKGIVQIGLQDSYDLLAELDHPVGHIWQEYRSKLMDLLIIRNYSILAHGVNPVSKEDYERYKNVLWEFILKCDEADPLLKKFNTRLDHYRDLPNQLPESL